MDLPAGADRPVRGAPPALSLRGVSKRFGAALALDGATLDVARGTIHALLGENGAGKTTLMRTAFGMLRPDGGTIEVDGAVRAWRSSADAIAAGLGMVHQHFMLIPAFTVAENVALGDRGFFSGYDPAAAAARVRHLGEATGLVLDPDQRVSELPVGAQQRLEIVKALGRAARLLILDEPTAVLSPAESDELYAWLRVFVSGGGTVVLITHKVREALALADDVTVLRRGRTVLRSAVSDTTEEVVVTALLGEALPARERAGPPQRTDAPDIVIAAQSVTVRDTRGTNRLRSVSVAVHAGEVLGVAGVEGAGQWELLRVLAGRVVPHEGSVRRPEHVGFVPEDRLRDALIPAMTLVENVALQRAGALRGLVHWSRFTARARAITETFDVRPRDAKRGDSLSGGNQQKFVLGRELDGSPAAIVVENPTRGLDIRASADVLQRIMDARDAGCAVAFYSSDLDEVLAVADRVIVCFDGHVREVARNADAVGRAMVGLP